MLRVAAVQMAPVFLNKEANLMSMDRLMRQAKGKADLIAFPELCTTGYSLMSDKEARSVAEPVEGLTFQAMLRLARAYDMTVVWGMVIEEKGKLYNGQVYIEPNGKWEKVYKINRFGQDWIWATAGDESPPIITLDDGTKVGLLICRDVRDKWGRSEKTLYSKGDADIVVLSTAWGDGGFPAVAWMDFAEQNKTALVVSNRYGRERNNNFGEGGVCVISKDGKVSCEGLRWNMDCIVYATID